mgnify:CR=1 FL=1
MKVFALQLGRPQSDWPTQLADRNLQARYQFISNNQATTIDYHHFQRARYYVGSASVKKTLDLLVCRQQKRRGQNSSQQGSNNIAAFRQMMLNDQWQNYLARTKNGLESSTLYYLPRLWPWHRCCHDRRASAFLCQIAKRLDNVVRLM